MKELARLREINEADPHGTSHNVRILEDFVHHNHLCLVFEATEMNLREVIKQHRRNARLSVYISISMLYVCMLNNFSSPLVVSVAGSGDVACVDVNACIVYVSMPVYPHMHLLCMSVCMCIYVRV